MKRSVFIAAMMFFALGSSLHAFEISPAASAGIVSADYEAGLLDYQTALVYRAYAYFDSQALPEKYRRAGEIGERFTCGTPILLDMRRALPELTGWAAQEIERLLALTPGVKENRPEPPAVAEGERTDYPDAVNTPNVHYTEHFAIRWGDNFSFNSGELERLEQIAENVWAVEVVEMGYTAPWNSDTYYTDIYVANSGNGAPEIDFQGAYTTLYNNTVGQDNMSYMVFWDEIFHYESSTKDIFSHEFFHVCQFQIALAGCYGHMFCDNCTWAVEGSAVWAEDEVYDEVDNYMQYVWMYMFEPEITLFSGHGYDPYNRVIFFKYISENFGGRDALFSIWNECHTTITHSVEGYLSDQGITIEEAFKEFAIKNLFSDYEEGDSYTTPNIFRRISNYPLNDFYESGSIPEVFGSNYVLFKPGDSADDRLNVRIEGEEDFWDNPVDWDMTFIKMRTDGSYELEEMGQSEKGATGQISFTGFGQEWSKIYAVINPLCDERYNSAPQLSYKLKATRGDDPFPVDDDDTEDDDVNDDADDDADDDDTQDDQPDCDKLIGLIYDDCGFDMIMSVQDAQTACLGAGEIWTCADGCAAQVQSCEQFAQCLAACGLNVDESGGDSDGDDDDDDDDACGC